MCRKFHGAAFATYGKVQSQDFRWLQGQALILIYQSSVTAERGFCRCCGSSLYYKSLGQDDQISIAIGTLDEEPSRSVDNSIFCSSMPLWSICNKDIPEYPEWRNPA
ncbi:MAG: GFA family protein [Porticoccaceae bacterium]|nr:GFA family protein [Porticoccaceae bacterium]